MLQLSVNTRHWIHIKSHLLDVEEVALGKRFVVKEVEL